MILYIQIYIYNIYIYIFIFIYTLYALYTLKNYINGEEICEVVGIYILHIIGKKYGKERIGLFKDDTLACVENTSGTVAERIRKTFIKSIKNELNRNIVIETNLKVANFLYLTLNLSTAKYVAYNKPDNKPLYITVNSNHPPKIIKNLLENVS